MSITDPLNSGALHEAARQSRPECVDTRGNIHRSPERAQFMNWVITMRTYYGEDVRQWPQETKDEYSNRYVKA